MERRPSDQGQWEAVTITGLSPAIRGQRGQREEGARRPLTAQVGGIEAPGVHGGLSERVPSRESAPRESALSAWTAGAQARTEGEGCPPPVRSWLPLAQLGNLFPHPSVLPSLHPHGLAPIGVSPPSAVSLQLSPGQGDPQTRARSAQHQAGGPPGWEPPRACRPCRCPEGRASSFSCTRRGRRNLTRVAVEMGPRPTLTASLRFPPRDPRRRRRL